MPTSLIQRSFAAGEIGPSLYGRADVASFQSGLKTCRNYMVMRHGGVTNRPGTQFLQEIKNSAVRSYFTKFVFNADQTYLIEMGDGYFRFYRQGAAIVVSTLPAWSLIANYQIGDLVTFGGANYYAKVANVNQQPPNATYWHPLVGALYEIPTPYVAADLATLQFVQSGDVVTITHKNYQPRELVRSGHTSWILRLITTAPWSDPPQNLNATPGPAGTLAYSYVVTAVKAENYEESQASSPKTVNSAAPTPASPNQLEWTVVPGAVEYNVYLDKDANGAFGFIGIAKQPSFNDIGFQPDFSISPPVPRTLFETPNDYPATAIYYQQRLFFARTNNSPERIDASRSGNFKNFTISSPIQDDDAIAFTLAGRQVNEVRHMVEIGKLAILTAGGEWTIQGDADGVLRPTAINPHQDGYNGASEIPPVIIGTSVIYVQARGGIVRDLQFEIGQYAYGSSQSGYGGKDLTLWSPHLFEGFTIERMAYAQIPHSIVWLVRSDGVLLGLTYMPEQETWGWHHHDTDGVFEDVAVLPEGDEDAVYVIVRRSINGVTKRYVERFASRRVTDVQVDAKFLDAFLSYNGLNSWTGTMTLSSVSGNWTQNDEITVTSSAAIFVAGDVGNAIDFWVPGVAICRIVLGTFVSPTVVKGYPNKTVLASLRNVASTSWAHAVDELAGLGHLEGKTVSILANGNVLAQRDVAGGKITLERPYAVIHVGLPITADFETLDVDSVNQVVRDRKKNVHSVSLLIESSRGIFAGPDADNLFEVKPEPFAHYNEAIALVTGLVEVGITGSWEQGGRVFIRQSDPLPLTILSIIPNADIGG